MTAVQEELFDPKYANLPDQLLDLPSSIFNPNRIRIMLELYHTSTADFTQLTRDLKLSDGALATHLRSLLRDNLIEVRQEHIGGRTHTAYLITKKGTEAVEALLENFERIRKAIPQ